MGFFSRFFGRGRSADVGITSDLVIPYDRAPIGTAEGNFSAVDELGRVTGGPVDLGFGDTGDLYQLGADSAVAADLGVDMSSHADDLAETEGSLWRNLGSRPNADDQIDPPSAEADRADEI